MRVQITSPPPSVTTTVVLIIAVLFTWYILLDYQEIVTRHTKKQKKKKTQFGKREHTLELDMEGMLELSDQECKTTMINMLRALSIE